MRRHSARSPWNDVDLTQLEDAVGWVATQTAGLTEERPERLLATLPDEHFPLERLELHLVRMSPTVHPKTAADSRALHWGVALVLAG